MIQAFPESAYEAKTFRPSPLEPITLMITVADAPKAGLSE